MNSSSGYFLFFLLLLPVPFLLKPDAAFPQEKTEGRLCPKCKSTGKIKNPFMNKNRESLEEGALHCSFRFEQDKKGHGLPWLPCERCRNPDLEKAAREEFETWIAREEEWLAERRKVDAVLGLKKKLLHIETEHFILAWNIPKITTTDKKVYKAHDALHLYAVRMENFYTDFMELLGLRDEEMRNRKHFIYLFETQKTSLKAAIEFTGLRCMSAAKMPGNPSIFVSWRDKSTMKTDDDFYRHVVHHMSHLLNVAFYRMEWLAKEAGWADEGLAHYFEIKYFGKADNTCDEEGHEEPMGESDWEVEVRKALVEDRAPSFAELQIQSTTALNGDEHKFAWSFVDFLLNRNPLRFRVFMKVIKEKRSAREALEESYGLNILTFQRLWEEYVLENYRKKPLKPSQNRRNRRR